MGQAAIYVRVSTEEQARHGYSLASQVEACEGRARALGAVQVLTFADEGVSGALLSRPELNRLREMVRGQSLDLVVVWDPDRLSRQLAHQLLLTEEFERAHVRLEFVNFEWQNTPEGQLFYALRGAIAQYEKEKIKERTQRGRLQKARQGRLPLAFRPYGYEYDPATALLIPNPAEAGTVREIFRWLVEEGEGPNGIARRLNLLGIPARKGGRWHRTVVRQILANPVYTGVFYAHRYDASGCSLNRHRPPEERIRPALRPESEWVPVAVPALVDPERWQAAQSVLAQARRLWAGRPRAFYLLSGLLVCGRCGQPMSGCQGTDWGVRRRKYTCRKSSSAAPGEWCGRSVAAEPLEEAVWGQLAAWLCHPDALWESTPPPETPAAFQMELEALAAAIEQAERGRGNIVALLEQGMLDRGEGAGSLQRIGERLAELESRRRRLVQDVAQVQAASREDQRQRQDRVAELVSRVRAGQIPDAERRQLMRAVVARAVVREREVEVHARWPDAFAGAE